MFSPILLNSWQHALGYKSRCSACSSKCFGHRFSEHLLLSQFKKWYHFVLVNFDFSLFTTNQWRPLVSLDFAVFTMRNSGFFKGKIISKCLLDMCCRGTIDAPLPVKKKGTKRTFWNELTFKCRGTWSMQTIFLIGKSLKQFSRKCCNSIPTITYYKIIGWNFTKAVLCYKCTGPRYQKGFEAFASSKRT